MTKDSQWLSLAFVLILAGCTQAKVDILAHESSPSGRRVAYLECIDNNGGATVGFVFRIVVAPAGEETDRDSWVWSAYSTRPREFHWSGEQLIEVVVSKSDDLHLQTIRTRERDGVTARSVVVP